MSGLYLDDTAVAQILSALRGAPGTCQYHGRDFGRLGTDRAGEPRCDSCKQSYRVAMAMSAVLTAQAMSARAVAWKVTDEGLQRIDPEGRPA